MAQTKKFLVHVDLSQQQLRNAALHGLADPTEIGTPVNGQFYYNTTSKSFHVWDAAFDNGEGNDPGRWVDFAARSTHTGTIPHTVINDWRASVVQYTLNEFAKPTTALDLNGQKITNLAAGTAPGDGVIFSQLTDAVGNLTMSVADEIDRLDDRIDVVTGSLADEVTARTDADATINTSITNLSTSVAADLDTEVTARIAGDNTLSGSIDTERARAIAAETALQSAIDGEIADRGIALTDFSESFAVDQARQDTNLTNEVTRATGVEADLSASILAETTRALAAEQVLSESIEDLTFADLGGDLEVDATGFALVHLGDPTDPEDATNVRWVNARISEEITTLSESISELVDLDNIADKAYVDAAANTLSGSVAATYVGIDTYTAGQAAQDDTVALLDTRIDELETLVQGNVQDQLDTLSGTFAVDQVRQDDALAALTESVDTRFTDVTGDLAAEVTRATDAEAALNTAITTEVTDRQNAITTLSQSFATDQARQDTDLATEVAARIAADNALSGTFAGAIDDEILARTNADNTLQGNIDAEVTARGQAITTLSGTVAVEDTALHTRIDTLEIDFSNEMTTLEQDLIFSYSAADTALSTSFESALNAEITARQNGDTAERQYVDGLSLSHFMAPSGSLSMDGQRITDVGTPVNANDAVNLGFLTDVLANTDWKSSVLVASNANVALAGNDTVDGVTLGVGDRVLLHAQTDATENGIYEYNGTDLVRTDDADAGSLSAGAAVFVEEGTYADTQWTLVTDDVDVGTTPLTFIQIGGAGTYKAGTGLVLDGTTFRVASNTTHKASRLLTDVDAGPVNNIGEPGYIPGISYTTDDDGHYYTVTHGLGTRIVTCQVYDETSGDTVECGVSRGTNSVTLSFNAAPPVDAYRVVVVG